MWPKSLAEEHVFTSDPVIVEPDVTEVSRAPGAGARPGRQGALGGWGPQPPRLASLTHWTPGHCAAISGTTQAAQRCVLCLRPAFTPFRD
jgi:hypothetical protein